MRYLIFVFFCSIFSCKPSFEVEKKFVSVVELDTLISKTLNRKLAYRVYSPKFKSTKLLPIIYLLHGHGGSDDDWFSEEEGNVKSILDSLILAERIPQLIAVTLDAGNSWYVDSIEPFETTYINEFIPFFESKYFTDSVPKNRYIAGNSAGGFGALRFSLKYPELFHSSILLSPAAYFPEPPLISSSRKIEVFNTENKFSITKWKSYAYPELLNTKSDITYPKFYMSTGIDDEYDIYQVISQLEVFFDSNNINVETSIIDGGHDWDVWRNRFTHDLTLIYEQN